MSIVKGFINAHFGYRYYAKPSTSVPARRWHHIDSVAPIIAKQQDREVPVIPIVRPLLIDGTYYTLMCGGTHEELIIWTRDAITKEWRKRTKDLFEPCDKPAAEHPILNAQGKTICYRKPNSIGHWVHESSTLGPKSMQDYYQSSTGNIILLSDYSGVGAEDIDTDFVDPLKGNDSWDEAPDSWHDADYDELHKTWISTSTTYDEHEGYVKCELQVTPLGKAYVVTPYEYDPQPDRSAYVEGQPGFIAKRFLDLLLTAKYHGRLLNVYSDKVTGDLRIGGIRIVKCADGSIDARCVRYDCSGCMNIRPNEADRDQMEDFVLAVIRHGNNHAADWFVTRDTFYTIQPSAPANVTELSDVEFVMEHQQYCNDARCTCDAWLAKEVPALLKETA